MSDVLTAQEAFWQASQFLYLEADLLDSRDYDAWLGLLDESIQYRVPIASNVRRDQLKNEYTAPGQLAWIDEGLATLRQRVAQFKTGMHWAEEPPSRVSHMVTNICVRGIEPQKDGSQLLRVRSRFLVNQNRGRAENSQFIGKREDTLRNSSTGLRLLQRDVYLDQSVLLAKTLTVFF